MPYNSLYKQKIEMGVELNWVIHGDKLKTLMTFLRLWVWYGRPDNLCLKRLLQYLVSKSHVLTTKRFFNRLTHVSSVNYVFRCYAYFQQWFWQFYEAIYDCFTLLREMFLKKHLTNLQHEVGYISILNDCSEIKDRKLTHKYCTSHT